MVFGHDFTQKDYTDSCEILMIQIDRDTRYIKYKERKGHFV